jgi:hypothetical protein
MAKQKISTEIPEQSAADLPPAASPPALRYTGGGYRGWLPNIPARDLTLAEVEQYGGQEQLLKTGLYALPDESAPASATEPAFAADGKESS